MAGVLFVIHFPPAAASSYRCAGLAKYLSRRGFETTFLCRRPAAGPEPAPAPYPDYPFREISYWREPLAAKFPENIRLLREESEGSSVIHVNRASPYTASVSALGNLGNKNLVVDMDDWDGYGGYSSYARLYGPKGGILTLFEGTFPRLGDLVVTVSHILSARMASLGIPPEKLVFVPNGYDEERFNASVAGGAARERYSLRGSKVVVYISTFHKFESEIHVAALTAFRIACRRIPDARMLIVGGGSFDMQALVASLGLGSNVTLTGRVPREDVPSLVAAADVALHVISTHPFHGASSPMVVPEYMAMGKPIVAPRTGEIAYNLSGGAGLLVERPEPELLAEGLVTLLEDASLREELGRAARTKASREYSYSVLARRLGEAYSRLPAR